MGEHLAGASQRYFFALFQNHMNIINESVKNEERSQDRKMHENGTIIEFFVYNVNQVEFIDVHLLLLVSLFTQH